MTILPRLPVLTFWTVQFATFLWMLGRVGCGLVARRPAPVPIRLRTRRPA